MDENNVGRFGEILREFSGRSQFIVITHNKRTVVNVDTLLGVTMDESGVTKLIAHKLRNAEASQTNIDLRLSTRFPDEDVEYEEGRELQEKGDSFSQGDSPTQHIDEPAVVDPDQAGED
jgi:chromosome segregation protein